MPPGTAWPCWLSFSVTSEPTTGSIRRECECDDDCRRHRDHRGEVRRSILAAQTHLERAAEEIVWQIENQAWEQIGYGSWDEMRKAE